MSTPLLLASNLTRPWLRRLGTWFNPKSTAGGSGFARGCASTAEKTSPSGDVAKAFHQHRMPARAATQPKPSNSASER